MSKSAKSDLPAIESRVQAETVLGELSADELKRKAMENRLASITRLAKAKYEPKIAELKRRIAAKEKALELWAVKSPAEFSLKRSVELLYGVIGFRLGNRTLKLRSKVTWEDVLGKLTGVWDKYVRRKPEVNKELILADCGGEQPVLSAEQLAAMGLKVVQEDNFFIDLKQP